MTRKSELTLDHNTESSDEVLKPFNASDNPKYPIGQIVFDINGEYANPNLQDEAQLFLKYSKMKPCVIQQSKSPVPILR